MLSQLMEALLLLLVLIASKVESSSTGSGVVGNNGKEKDFSAKILAHRRQNVNQNRKVGAEISVISRSDEENSNKFNYHRRIRLRHGKM